MEITEVRVFPRNEEKLKAYVTITFDNCFVVRNLKVIQGQSGLFVAMPSRKMADGSHKDVAHPVNNETRKIIEEKVLNAYQEKLKDPKAFNSEKSNNSGEFGEEEKKEPEQPISTNDFKNTNF
ncbi:septation regulator SpoVG [bacterium]|nr:septation regulator SpoVG [bacterium]